MQIMSRGLKELKKKIEEKNRRIIRTIEGRTDTKINSFRTHISKAVSKQRRKITKGMKEINEKIEVEMKTKTEKLNKMKTKLEKIQQELKELNFEAFQEELREYREQIAQEVKVGLVGLDKLEDRQNGMMEDEIKRLSKDTKKIIDESMRVSEE